MNLKKIFDSATLYAYDVYNGYDCIVGSKGPFLTKEDAINHARNFLLENFVPIGKSKEDGLQVAIVYDTKEVLSLRSFDTPSTYVIASYNRRSNHDADCVFPKWLAKMASNPDENLCKTYYDWDKYCDVTEE